MTLSEAIKPDIQGKVRDIYDLGDRLLMVASDRISAFDFILPDLIPAKGEVLTQMSIYWFETLEGVIGSHFLTADVSEYPARFKPYASELAGRSMLVAKVDMFPVECIVRGYLTGSGLKEYQASGSLAGLELPAGLVEASKLEYPVYTPSTKAAVGDHDLPLTLAETVELFGERDAMVLASDALELYQIAAAFASRQGIIIADTKFEFGSYEGHIVLADEVLTPDSSRFWPAESYLPGQVQPSYDKQFVRDWLKANWDFQGEPPHLPADVIAKTSKRYIEAYELLTGEAFIRRSDTPA